ncbi:MAG: ParA family protein [gamma proteobacterium symbiont of Bathyaustriella thionipta]|nr:ParA family protein [gamma proteobacterium symbiont of Bathyaustriella thionipta]
MRTIMVMNAKGGCGKTTLATNIATFYADDGQNVVIADFDPQGSSIDWLTAREDYTGIPEISGIEAWHKPLNVPDSTDLIVMDVPAGIHGKDIDKALAQVQTLVVPVLPSAIDIRAAARFLKELKASGRVCEKRTRIGLVANRVRENTHVFHELENFLKKSKIPCVATLRESQTYIRSAETGLGLYELPPSSARVDVDQWESLMRWMNSKRSMPR